MQKVIIIIGMPGSGKTTFMENNRPAFGGAVALDDFHSLSDVSRRLSACKDFLNLKDALIRGRDVVISDIIYCEKKLLDQIKDDLKDLFSEINVDATIECIYFENNPSACIQNVYARNRKGVEGEITLIKNSTDKYVIPSNARVIPVYMGQGISKK